ncbi:c-type cytochrome biogenesis protein CcmI [Alteromonas sp. ASW11-36]|uniref:C-type cytochrome biogenesis protein CcmI n=1 Tax=Alteromonas arenosi TaxID=3055817 RepID=A0ABT7T163_9ALTE|nr:c-type cytochrome biogenesis protein CcmI [Alteromonas sp. ASW11-36]MDM7861964.1 c-type cytochrome biogenesis protein CcmI [Alteromonas sp. ASW11-36]
MTWPLFYFVVAGLLGAIVLTISLPWLRARNQRQADQLRNAQIVKQRLAELEREVTEGLISEEDKDQAVTELKLALVEESQATDTEQKNRSTPAIIVGLVISLGIAVPVYYRANHITEVKQLVAATDSVSELSDKLIAVMNDNAEITPQELQSLALAIRQRLRDTPDDEQAWLNLGRLYMSIGFSEQSVQSFERAFRLAPENTNVRLSFAQALMLSGTDENLQRSRGLLLFELEQQPQNDNLLLMATVVSAQLGNLVEAEELFAKIKDKMDPTSSMYQTIVARLDELRGIAGVNESEEPINQEGKTGFSVTVAISEELKQKLPSSGFLFVFAQDAGSQMQVPAAVVKIPLPELPVTVELTTDNAMLPTFTLAQVEQARLVARVSVDGDVSAVNGELEGVSEMQVSSGLLRSATITIDQEIK